MFCLYANEARALFDRQARRIKIDTKSDSALIDLIYILEAIGTTGAVWAAVGDIDTPGFLMVKVADYQPENINPAQLLITMAKTKLDYTVSTFYYIPDNK
jgi:hypothetical protein